MTGTHEFELPGSIKVFALNCRCGRSLYLALSSEVPGLFALARTPEGAIDALVEKLSKPDIPDFLPEDF